MNKRKRNTVILFFIVIVLAVILVIINNRSMRGSSIVHKFAVSDTASITKIHLADKDGNSVLLERISPADWRLNGQYKASKPMIESLLSTAYNVEVQGVLQKAARETAIKRMAAKHNKIEIYQSAPMFKIFGIKFFVKERVTKSYYVGDATQDNVGTYMQLEGDDDVDITFVPGQNAFLTLRYSAREKDWRDHTVIAQTINDIKAVEVEIPDKPEESYVIEKTEERRYALTPKDGSSLSFDVDTFRILDFVSSFRKLNYEGLLNDLSPHKLDSILSTTPMFIITVTTNTDEEIKLKMFRRKSPYVRVDEVTGDELYWDLDRLYVLFNNGKDFALCQYFTFDKILRPLSWYDKENREMDYY